MLLPSFYNLHSYNSYFGIDYNLDMLLLLLSYCSAPSCSNIFVSILNHLTVDYWVHFFSHIKLVHINIFWLRICMVSSFYYVFFQCEASLFSTSILCVLPVLQNFLVSVTLNLRNYCKQFSYCKIPIHDLYYIEIEIDIF